MHVCTLWKSIFKMRRRTLETHIEQVTTCSLSRLNRSTDNIFYSVFTRFPPNTIKYLCLLKNVIFHWWISPVIMHCGHVRYTEPPQKGDNFSRKINAYLMEELHRFGPCQGINPWTRFLKKIHRFWWCIRTIAWGVKRIITTNYKWHVSLCWNICCQYEWFLMGNIFWLHHRNDLFVGTRRGSNLNYSFIFIWVFWLFNLVIALTGIIIQECG